MRHYYNVHSLLKNPSVQEFIGSPEYLQQKADRFPKADFDIAISENQAFLLSEPGLMEKFTARYQKIAGLYYNGQPRFAKLMPLTGKWINKL